MDDRGRRLRRARQRAGLTLSDLGRTIGTSAATLSRAETGRVRLTADRLARLADALDVDVEDLAATGDGPLAAGDEPGAFPGAFVPEEPGSWRRYDPLALPPALQAGLDSFLELGYHGASVRQIAHRAQLSVPGLYHHFPTKQDLLVAVMDLTVSDFYARCLAARDEAAAARERFVSLVECFALYHSYRSDLAFIAASELRSLDEPHRQRIASRRTECQHLLSSEVVAMVRDGSATTSLADDAGRAVAAMLVGIAGWYRTDGALTPEENARRYVLHAGALVGMTD